MYMFRRQLGAINLRALCNARLLGLKLMALIRLPATFRAASRTSRSGSLRISPASTGLLFSLWNVCAGNPKRLACFRLEPLEIRQIY